ncbi:MAG: permease [Gemmatimonadaceae bacterium]|nr:permease [Gemmatimonadaceae bacterium]
MSFGLLPASLAALAAGPALANAVDNRPGILTFLDGFVLVAIGGIVLLDVVPYMLMARDLWVIPCLIVGFCLPSFAERLFQSGVAHTHRLVIGLAFIGLAVHSALDGSALSHTRAGTSGLLGVGVLLHQVPVSMLIWRVLKPVRRYWMWLLLTCMCVATVLGYLYAPDILAVLPARAGEWLSAFVGGSLLHVVLHTAPGSIEVGTHAHAHAHTHGAHCAHEHDHKSATKESTARPVDGWPSGLGALLALGALIVFQLFGDATPALPMLSTLWFTFRSLSLESAPALLVGFAVAGVISTLSTSSSVTWLSRGSRLWQALKGIVVGLPLPICSCGVVPLYQGMIQRGTSQTAALAFLVATPELGIDAVLLSIPLLGARFAAVRVVAAALTALSVALWIGGRSNRREAPLAAASESQHQPIAARIRRAIRAGFGEMVDHTAPWILVGLVVASIVAPALQNSWVARLDPTIGVIALALLGLPLYVCASASTPLVAVMVAAGVSPGAGLALLITGPATNAATMGVLTRMHGRGVAVQFGVVMTLSAIALGVLTNAIMPFIPLSNAVVTIESGATLVEKLSLLAIVVLFGASLLRRGARAFVAELQFARAV